jgi:hypothetical protein
MTPLSDMTLSELEAELSAVRAVQEWRRAQREAAIRRAMAAA